MDLIILNPWADKGGARRREPALRRLLAAAGHPFELVHTAGPGDAERLARAAATASYRAVVAAGGDGTINEVANGLMGSPAALGLLPIGTGNDFVKVVGLSHRDLPAAVRRLATAKPRRIDVGQANGRYFLNGLGAGFDARVAVEAARLRRLRGFAVYVVAILRALRRFGAPALRVSFADQVVERRMLLVSVGNGRCHGGGFWITPQAEIDDGQLDLCLVDRLRLDEFVRHVPKVLRGRHTALRQVTMARTTALTIEAAEPIAAHVDGEILGTALTRIEVRLHPAALAVVA